MEWFVAVSGNDNNLGTIESPFATIERALNSVDKGDIIYLRAGEYFRYDSLVIKHKDVTIKAYNNEKVVISGAAKLDAKKFKKVEDEDILQRLPQSSKDFILEYDLKEDNIFEYGEIKPYGFGFPTYASIPQLFVNDKVMTIARYPSEGFIKTGEVFSEKSFITDAPADKWGKADNIWVYGYFVWEWADSVLKVEKIDGNTVHTRDKSFYGVQENKPFYFFNLLEELSSPGEWFLDTKTGKFYIYPGSDLENAQIYLSISEKPLIYMEDCENITIENICIRHTRSNGISMVRGRNNKIYNCEISKIGQSAVVIGEIDRGAGLDLGEIGEGGDGGVNNGVEKCEIFDIGMGGIILAGGDRKSLTPCNNYAKDNHIYRFAEVSRTYRPAVSMFGVGCLASHNKIHDAMHNAIAYEGNDHIIEFNEIYDVLKMADDSGVIYSLRDWSFRGNTIRYNYIHDIKKGTGGQSNFCIYCDDCMSGALIYGNLFENAPIGIFTHGGRDHIVENNLFIDCDYPVKFANFYHSFVEKGSVKLKDRLENMPYKSELWAKKYPRLVNILDDEPMLPKGIEYKNNIILNCQKKDAGVGIYYMDALQNMKVQGNVHKIPSFEPKELEQILRSIK